MFSMVKVGHSGHRQRMRDKMKNHGERVFEDYELFEMLFYNTIPVRDTKPLAKALLQRFGGVEAVLSASKEELCSVSGVGEKTAALIKAVAALPEVVNSEREECEPPCDYDYYGRFLVDYFRARSESSVIMLSLDNRMHLIALDEIYSLDCASAGVRPENFVKTALKRNAACVIIAHNHPHGPLFPTEGDVITNSTVSDTLFRLGFGVAEHYIICGERYLGFTNHMKTVFRQPSEALTAFIRSKQNREYTGEYPEASPKREAEYLRTLLGFSAGSASGEAEALIDHFGSTERVLETDLHALSGVISERSAVLIRCAVALSRMRVKGAFRLGRRYSDSEHERLLRGILLCEPRETAYMLSLDSEGRLIAISLLGEGTVSYTSILPRSIIELAQRTNAKTVIIAHNHPSGYAKPSDADIVSTAEICRALYSVGVVLSKHYIVAPTGIADILPEVVGKEEK